MEEICKLLKLSSKEVDHHLRILIKNSLVEKIGERRHYLYYLSEYGLSYLQKRSLLQVIEVI